MRPAFDSVARLWEPDGSLRDIHVHNMTDAHWEQFDRLLDQYDIAYSFDHVQAPFPGSQAILANRDGTHLLAIALDGAAIHCHFFIPEELEFDIDPRSISGPLQHQRVLAFIEGLAEALQLPAAITPENSEETPFLVYSPVRRSWLSPGISSASAS